MAKRKSKPTQKEKPPQIIQAKESINPRFIAVEAHVVPMEQPPACERCGSREHVKPVFVGPWDEPGHHNLGDVITTDSIPEFWCEHCNCAVGPARKIGGQQ